MTKDNTLIYRAQTGDEQAFADLVREYHAFVYAIVVRMVTNSHDAEEVVQDTFLNVYQGLTQLEDATKFKSWLGEIAQNCGRNWLRKQRGDTVSIDEVGEQMLQTEDSSDERLTRLEQRELIRRTIETLPQKDREIVRAFYLEGASYDELTSAHGLSYNAIAFRLSRAKRQLTKRLQYLLTGIFVSPTITLKKFYSGGLTAMKIGTVPKITVGVAALIALIFIGFIGVRQMNAPTVEERVYLSPWEDGTPRPRNSSEDLAAQTNSTQDRTNRDNQSQISGEGLEMVDDSLNQLQETDTAQFTAESESDIETDLDLFADISTLLDNEGQSAEDVMNAYVVALRSLDAEGLGSLVIGAAKEKFESGMLPILNGEVPKELVDMYYSEFHDMLPPERADKMVDEMIQMAKKMLRPALKQMYDHAEVVSSEHVGDEFHFRLRTLMPEMLLERAETLLEMPEISQVPGLDIPEMPEIPDSETQLHKMRKENGVWRIYYDAQ